ncbi:Unknown protein sequence [Pseudomonas syringae pv. maculicola]|nr:Unknown protein sequence [Pseudomonas syringae pv. maculicola]
MAVDTYDINACPGQLIGRGSAYGSQAEHGYFTTLIHVRYASKNRLFHARQPAESMTNDA